MVAVDGGGSAAARLRGPCRVIAVEKRRETLPQEATMLPSLLVELSAHERRTLFRIANGDARSGTHDPADVRRLQLLVLIEDEGPFIHMTALGKQRVERLGVR
jgi:hypothetical protein